ncbi:MAG TPA: DUF3784 domain-containing protein [Saprospiraceae bacterium]|nr:DUF3784 domain-containing protein [Saprospiraceae bacterium]MCC6689841.1 DUF3784 domain-containing protein [Saprospiraceae bacterium]HMV23322.1 DUF3784 domain-containing protein [Saprospiraceae bacterium]HMW74412.1 DUF3784 domain-containing protein [Saprospiraceae bacterium]HMX83073.1 DUF3784 domain-containing protein [Saprospiraceae bacterium]
MVLAFFLLSLIFLGVGLTVTESNAKYLVSGYNSLSESERRTIDIKPYIKYFRHFHYFLSGSILILGLLLYYFVSKNLSGIFLGTYPILAYMYFLWRSKVHTIQIGKKEKAKFWAIFSLLCIILLLIGIMFYSSMRENKIITDNNIINITGEYGEKINIREIKSISLVDSLPDISIKMNGFALETIKKGLFKTQSDETVKLIINSDQHPLLLITTEDGRKIYYSAKTNSNKQLYDELRMRLNK